MAVTLTRRQTDKARELIKTEKICEALQKNIDGEVKMAATQINAARILLDRSLPCLTATSISADGDIQSIPLLTIVPSDDSAAA